MVFADLLSSSPVSGELMQLDPSAFCIKPNQQRVCSQLAFVLLLVAAVAASVNLIRLIQTDCSKTKLAPELCSFLCFYLR